MGRTYQLRHSGQRHSVAGLIDLCLWMIPPPSPSLVSPYGEGFFLASCGFSLTRLLLLAHACVLSLGERGEWVRLEPAQVSLE